MMHMNYVSGQFLYPHSLVSSSLISHMEFTGTSVILQRLYKRPENICIPRIPKTKRKINRTQATLNKFGIESINAETTVFIPGILVILLRGLSILTHLRMEN